MLTINFSSSRLYFGWIYSVLVFRPISLSWASESADWLIPTRLYNLLPSSPNTGKAEVVIHNMSLSSTCADMIFSLQDVLESEPNTQDLGRIVQKSIPPLHVTRFSEIHNICSLGLSGAVLIPEQWLSHFLGKVCSQPNYMSHAITAREDLEFCNQSSVLWDPDLCSKAGCNTPSGWETQCWVWGGWQPWEQPVQCRGHERLHRTNHILSLPLNCAVWSWDKDQDLNAAFQVEVLELWQHLWIKELG